MESIVRQPSEEKRPSRAINPAGVVLALGAAILIGFAAYSAFLAITQPVEFDGATINAFRVGSTVDEAGIQPDDIITHVNGTRLTSLPHAGQLFDDSVGRSMMWDVVRDDETISYEILPDPDAELYRGTVGVFLSDHLRGRKDMILDMLPLAYAGVGVLVLGLVMSLGMRRMNRRDVAEES